MVVKYWAICNLIKINQLRDADRMTMNLKPIESISNDDLEQLNVS